MPVLKQGLCLIATLQSDLTDSEWRELQSTLVGKIGSAHARDVILDLTSMTLLDSFAGKMVNDIAQMIRFRGANTIIVGIQPEVAFTLVQLGLHLRNVTTALDLEEALASLARKESESTGECSSDEF
ncbi:MAG: STAS domain-containing protein [Bdellovibrionota bacterium]